MRNLLSLTKTNIYNENKASRSTKAGTTIQCRPLGRGGVQGASRKDVTGYSLSIGFTKRQLSLTTELLLITMISLMKLLTKQVTSLNTDSQTHLKTSVAAG